MAIEWNKVTCYSQTLAIVLFVVIFFLGYAIGSSKHDPNAGIISGNCERGERCGPGQQ